VRRCRRRAAGRAAATAAREHQDGPQQGAPHQVSAARAAWPSISSRWALRGSAPGVLFLEVKNLTVAGGITKAQVRRLMKAGWEIDAHTITHPDLTTLDASSLRNEVSGSRAALRRDFHVPVDNFAYPAGRHDAAAEAAVRAAGFQTAVTTDLGLAHIDGNPTTLPRVRVNGTDSAAAVLQAVQSAR